MVTAFIEPSRAIASAIGLPAACAACVPDARSFRSAPEQNTGAVWVSTSARTSGCSARSSAAFNSVTSWRDSALRLPGESSVMVATPPSTMQ